MPFRVTDIIQPSNSEINKFSNSGFLQALDVTEINTAIAGFQSQLGITSGTDLSTIANIGSYKWIVDNPADLPAAINTDIGVQAGDNTIVAGTGDIIRTVREIYRDDRGYTFEVLFYASNTGDRDTGLDNANTPFGTKGTIVFNTSDSKYYGYSGVTYGGRESGWEEVGTGIKYTRGITAPQDPAVGEKWFETRTAIEFTYLGEEEGWVAVNVAAGATGSAGTPGAQGATGFGFTAARISGNDLLINRMDSAGTPLTPAENLGRVVGRDGVPFARYRLENLNAPQPAGPMIPGRMTIQGIGNQPSGFGLAPKITLSLRDASGLTLTDYWTSVSDDASGYLYIVSEATADNYAIFEYYRRTLDTSTGQGGLSIALDTTKLYPSGNLIGISADLSAGAGSSYSVYAIPKGQVGPQGETGEDGLPGQDGPTGATGSVGNIAVFRSVGGALQETFAVGPNTPSSFPTDATIDTIRFKPAWENGVLKMSGSSAQAGASGDVVNIRMEVGGETGTGITRDVNPDSWATSNDYVSRKFMFLDEYGHATFGYIQVGDIFAEQDLRLSISSFGWVGLTNGWYIFGGNPVDNEPGPSDSDIEAATPDTSLQRVLIGPEDIGGITLDRYRYNPSNPSTRAHGFVVKYGPINAPTDPAGVTLSITSSHAFVGATDDFDFAGNQSADIISGVGGATSGFARWLGLNSSAGYNPSVSYLGTRVGGSLNGGADPDDLYSMAVEYPTSSNSTVTLTVDVENAAGETDSASINMSVGNYVYAGATSSYTSSNVQTLCTALGSSTAFDGHAGGNIELIQQDSDINPGVGKYYGEDVYMKSDISSPKKLSWADDTFGADGADENSYFYIAYPSAWFTNGGIIAASEDVTLKNANETVANLTMQSIGTGTITNDKGFTETYKVFKTTQANRVNFSDAGYIQFKISNG